MICTILAFLLIICSKEEVRTKTWTTRVVLEGVCMHDKETVGLFVLALEDGMSTRDAAEFAGVSYRCARN